MTHTTDTSWWGGYTGILGEDPDLPLLHQRTYLVRGWKVDDTTLMLRGAVMDLRPGEMFAQQIRAAGGVDDGHPITIHHMVVDLTVGFPNMTIDSAKVRMKAHPHQICPLIEGTYQQLVGLSIARGFTHQVRERFGGPRGCTHTTALLQAMAPVAVQCAFPMRHGDQGDQGGVGEDAVGKKASRLGEQSFMRGTCHVWAEDGEMWQLVSSGQMTPGPIQTLERIRRAGVDPRDVNPWG